MTINIPPQDSPQPPRRRWKRTIAIWLALAVFGGLTGLVMLSNSDPAKLAVTTAQASPALIAQLGTPIRKGWLVSGSIEFRPAAGQAHLEIPVSGPKARGTLYVEAQKHAGSWRLELLQYGATNSSERLDLLTPNAVPYSEVH